MKTLRFFLMSIMMLLTVCVANAQSNGNDFFLGKWNVEVTGTPQGDASMTLILERDKDGKLIGHIQLADGGQSIGLKRVDETDGNGFKAYFTASGYDCYLTGEKTADDEFEGTVNDMFDAAGKKIKDEKK